MNSAKRNQWHRLDEQVRLAAVKFRLRMIETEIDCPELDVATKKTEPLWVLSRVISRDHELNILAKEIRQALVQ